MKKVVATLPKISLEFTLTAPVETPALKKKMQNMGWPSVWLHFSSDPDLRMREVEQGKFQYEDGDFGETIPLSEPEQTGEFVVQFDADKNSVELQMSGEFLVYGATDEESAQQYSKITEAYLSVITINNEKGKAIKLPKDEFGIARELEGVVTPGDYGDTYYKLPVSISCSEAEF